MKITVKKPTSRRLQFNVKLTKDEYAKLERIALKTNRSMTEILRICINELEEEE